MSSEAPDFVIVGGQFEGHVYLLASKTLTDAELRHEADEFDMRNRRRGDYATLWDISGEAENRLGTSLFI